MTTTIPTDKIKTSSEQPSAISEYLSQKIKFLTTISMIFVVFIHAYNYTDTFLQPMTCITEGLHIGAMTQFFFSNAFTRSAVPIYFIVSGYLFFAKRELTSKVYTHQIQKRLKSVLYVFLVVSTVSFACCTAIYTVTGAGVFPVIDERMAVVEQGLTGVLKIWLSNPFAFQLWFLMQLFLICLLTPLINWFIIRFNVLLPALFIVPWWFDIGFGIGSYNVFNADTYLFFTFGAWLGIKKIKLPGMDKPIGKKAVSWIMLACLTALSAIYTVYCASITVSSQKQMMLFKLITIVGIAAVWYLYDIIPNSFINSVPWKTLQKNSFVIFLLHEPLMHMIFQRGLAFSQSDCMHMLLYFGLPVLMILLMSAVGTWTRRYCPACYKILTGGR